MLATTQAHSPTGWSDLVAELDIWADTGRTAPFWWRDDDATRPGPALERLISVADGIPLSLAVIPAGAEPALARFLDGVPGATVLQHGYAHTNHAPAGEKKAEFGAHRPAPAMLAEIAAGRDRLSELFGDRFLPVFVPPWNRIADSVVAGLGGCGFELLSTFGRRHSDTALPLRNCHIDLIDWHGSRGFLGIEPVLGTLVALLAEFRLDAPDKPEPVGIMTHHRDHDAAGWQFLATLRDIVRDHPGAEWTPIAEGAAVM